MTTTRGLTNGCPVAAKARPLRCPDLFRCGACGLVFEAKYGGVPWRCVYCRDEHAGFVPWRVEDTRGAR